MRGDSLVMLRRAIVWRRGASMLTVLLAAIAVGAAIVGPLFVQAGGDSLTRSAVAGGSEADKGITLAPRPEQTSSVSALRAEQRLLFRRFGLGGVYGTSIATVDSGIHVTGLRATVYAAQLLSRTGICTEVTLVSGSCHLGAGDALLSTRSAAKLGVSVGSLMPVTAAGTFQRIRLRVAGLYLAPNLSLPEWFDQGTSYFPYGFSTGPPDRLPELDAMIVTRPTALAVPPQDPPSITLQTPLRPGTIGQGNGDRIRRSLGAAQGIAEGANDTLTTYLPELISAADHQRHLLATIVAVAAVQLALLAIWVLTAVLLRGAELRRGELRVARLRGFPARSMLAVGVGEPAILCAVGAVLGAVGAWEAVAVFARARLYPGTTVSVDAWVFVGLLAAVLTIAVVLGLSVARLLRNSDLGQTARTGSSGRFDLAADVTILVLAAAGLLAAATSGALASHGNPIAAAAPALVALATSVIAIRLVGAVCRRAIVLMRDTRHVGAFLAVTQVGRRSATLRDSRSLIIALCLACFAVSAWAVAGRNRVTAARFAIGAPTVVNVTAGQTQLEAAVDRADPAGRWAMAVIQVPASDSEVLAVQTSRLLAVASWPPGVSRASLSQVGRLLTPRTPAAVNVGSGVLRLRLGASATGIAAARLPDLQVSAWVFNPGVGTTIIDLGQLHAGIGAYRGTLGASCPGGCRLDGVGLVPTTGAVPAGEAVTLTFRPSGSSAGAGGSPGVDLPAAAWRAGAAGVHVERAGGEVSFTINSTALTNAEDAAPGITPPDAAVADFPELIPAVAGATAAYSATVANGTSEISVSGIDGNPVSLRPVVTATAVPSLGSDGEMADLSLLERAQTAPPIPAAETQVWIGSAAPADAVGLLRRAGLRVMSVSRASQGVARARYSGPALAYEFMLLATLLALFTVAVSTLGVLAANTTERAVELTALEVVGVRRGQLRRSLGAETAILAGTALFGVLAGIVSAAIAIPSLPQLGSASSAPLSFALPAGWIAVVAVCVVLVILIAGAVAGRGIMARVNPRSLRDAADAGE